jgi:small subunit ribosomal protein S17
MENNTIERNSRRKRQGIVTSNKMDKTITVAISSNTTHPIYKKVVRKTKNIKVHDEANLANVGDTVEIMETRQLSKDKYFRLVRIIKKAK